MKPAASPPTTSARAHSAVQASHRRAVTGLAFSPTTAGEFASTAIDGSLRLSRVASGGGGEIRAHDLSALSLAYMPDGKSLVTGGADGEIRVWESAL
jgi:WD40 repeat protein